MIASLCKRLMILAALSGLCGLGVFAWRISADLWDALALWNLVFAGLNFLGIGLTASYLKLDNVQEH